MRLMVNEDPNHFYIYVKSDFEIEKFIDQYKNTGVTDLFISINGQRSVFGSKNLESFWDGLDEYLDEKLKENKDSFYETSVVNMKKYNRNGEVTNKWVERCREIGISPWLSFRMNDGHDLDVDWHAIQSNFWRDHPEYRRVIREPKDKRTFLKTKTLTECFDNGFDYSHDLIRDKMFKYIEESLKKFDVYGIELDWMRFGYCFKPGHEAEGRETLNTYTREIKSLLKKYEQIRGHKISLAVRVPFSIETAYELGYDVLTWAREGLIELLTVCPFWYTSTNDVAVKLWKELLKGTNVELSVGIELLISAYFDAPKYYSGREITYGNVWSLYTSGADSVCLFNYMNIDGEYPVFESTKDYQTFLENIVNLDKLNNYAKRFVLTFNDVVVPGRACSSNLPITLSDETFTQNRINIGLWSKNKREVYLVFALKNNDKNYFSEVYFNDKKVHRMENSIRLPDPAPDGDLISYKIEGSFVHSGYNIIETYGGKGTIEWMEIFVK